MPINDRERLITWLINSGYDDLVVESDVELYKLRICSKHFSSNAIFSSGRLKKNADPLLYPTESDNKSDTSNDIKDNEQIQILKAELKHKNNIIRRLNKRNKILTHIVRIKKYNISFTKKNNNG